MRQSPGRPATPGPGDPFVGGALVGRATLIEEILEAAAHGEAVEVVAPCGYGKSAVLDGVAAAIAERFGRPVVATTADPTMADTLRSLAHVLAAGDATTRPSLKRAAAVVRGRSRAIVLDDVSWSEDEVARFVALTRGCLVVISADRPVLGEFGRSVSLPGLDLSGAEALFAARLGRAPARSDAPSLATLVRAVKGRPLSLLQAVSLITHHERRLDLGDLADAASRDARVLDRLTARRLTPAENRMLQALTLVAGAVLPGDVVGLIADVDDAVEALEQLAGRGLVTRRDDRYGLPLCRTTAYRHEAVDGLLLGHAARVLADQLAGQGGDGDLLDVADAAVRLLRLAAEQHEWATVLRLVKAVEPILSLAGKWDTARDVLRIGMSAARWVGDPQTEARLRRRLDAVPSAGPALLDTLRALVRRRPRWLRRAVTGAVLAVSLLSLVIAGADTVGRLTMGGPQPPGQALTVTPSRLAFAARAVGSPSAAAVVTVSNRGRSPSDALTVSLAPQGGDFAVAADGCTGKGIAPQQVCAVKVVFRPTRAGTRRATLTVTPAGGTPQEVMLEGVGRDTAGPRLALPGALLAEATGPSGAQVRFQVSATDAQGRPITPRCTPESGELFALGVTTTVTCRATDSAKRTTSGQFTVTVSDSTAPQILVAPTTFEADGPEGARSTPYKARARDVVSGTLPVTCTGAPPSPAAIGTYPMTCSARDTAGNEATKRVVLRVVDTRPPVIVDLPTTEVTITEGESVDLGKARAEDAVDEQVPLTCTPLKPPLGESTVSCAATDRHGNTAHATFPVNVQEQVE